jgi:hypothetical protein
MATHTLRTEPCAQARVRAPARGAQQGRELTGAPNGVRARHPCSVPRRRRHTVTHMRTHAHTCTRARTHMHTHTHTHTHTHARARAAHRGWCRGRARVHDEHGHMQLVQRVVRHAAEPHERHEGPGVRACAAAAGRAARTCRPRGTVSVVGTHTHTHTHTHRAAALQHTHTHTTHVWDHAVTCSHAPCCMRVWLARARRLTA